MTKRQFKYSNGDYLMFDDDDDDDDDDAISCKAVTCFVVNSNLEWY